MTFLENLENMIAEGWATEAEVKAASELRRLYALNAEQQVVMKQALEALKAYGAHASNCDYLMLLTSLPPQRKPCSCGLHAAIAQAEIWGNV